MKWLLPALLESLGLIHCHNFSSSQLVRDVEYEIYCSECNLWLLVGTEEAFLSVEDLCWMPNATHLQWIVQFANECSAYMATAGKPVEDWMTQYLPNRWQTSSTTFRFAELSCFLINFCTKSSCRNLKSSRMTDQRGASPTGKRESNENSFCRKSENVGFRLNFNYD